ncbi:ExbD/TolR family protein [bacterium]
MRRRKLKSDPEQFEDLIDLTAVVNVALILVVVFLCVSPMTLITGITASQSKTGVSIGRSTKEDNVRINLNRHGIIQINEQAVLREKFVQLLVNTLAKSKTKDVMITADKENLVKEVVELLDLSKQNGARKVIIMK